MGSKEESKVFFNETTDTSEYYLAEMRESKIELAKRVVDTFKEIAEEARSSRGDESRSSRGEEAKNSHSQTQSQSTEAT